MLFITKLVCKVFDREVSKIFSDKIINNRMPELPEVETVLRALRSGGIIDSPISQIEIKKEFHLKAITSDNFINSLLGKNIKKIERKGK